MDYARRSSPKACSTNFKASGTLLVRHSLHLRRARPSRTGQSVEACFFSMLLDQRLAELKLNVQTRPVGWAAKSGQTPVAYDLTYCSELGIGVYKLFSEGKTGCMVYVDGCGNVEPLYLKDLQDPRRARSCPTWWTSRPTASKP